ncbi:MAG: CDGSH iron-sulfur domain-containing protein [Chloroflexi bacterium]|nr:CDGSH iron-sulfur domain-containing protein [Chloroflexota bacterium]MCL5947350.1 CDGSH iron-sulfur domain-containing protein [Chloroflexota bacterium]
MAEVTITATRNGPYMVKGQIKLIDPQGNDVTLQGDEIYLCRCGHSEHKPFCDGSHKRVGFKASDPAPSQTS